MSLSCGQAAVGIIANSLAAKLSMSVMWRNPFANRLQFTTPAFKRAFKNHSSAQLNEAEYAPSASSSPLVFLLGLPLVSLSLCFVVFLSCLTVLSFFFLAFFSFPFLSSLFLFFVSSLFSISLSFRHTVLAAMLLYLHSNNVECPWGATLAVTGQVVYFWGRVLTGKVMPVTPMGALPRYIAFGLLGYAIYGTL